LYAKDPSGIEFEVMWRGPPQAWGGGTGGGGVIAPPYLGAELGQGGGGPGPRAPPRPRTPAPPPAPPPRGPPPLRQRAWGLGRAPATARGGGRAGSWLPPGWCPCSRGLLCARPACRRRGGDLLPAGCQCRLTRQARLARSVRWAARRSPCSTYKRWRGS